MTIGGRLVELRHARNLTQAALAKRAGLSREYVLRVEAGLHDPTLGKAARLAIALGVSIDDLMTVAKNARRTRRRRIRPMTEVQRPFEEALVSRLRAAQRHGAVFVDVTSGDLHREVGGYPGTDHRMPVCCSVMERQMSAGDRIMRAPRKGKGATLTIRYRLPRG